MIIKNKNELATTGSRREALDIVEAGIERVLPPNIMKAAITYEPDVQVLSIKDDGHKLAKGRLFVIGGGKASGMMATTLEEIVGAQNITAGIVNCKDAAYRTSRIKIVEAGHPIPDERGLSGVEEMLSLRQRYRIGEGDLVLCLISGGGSALMPCPVDGISLKDMQNLTQLLLKCGAEIGEINAVRKHLSRTKGGRLGRYFSPATVVSLILSDVIGNNLDVIASGPTLADSSTYRDAYQVLVKYRLLTEATEGIADFLKKGCHGEVGETPKELANCNNYIIGDNRLALETMAAKAKKIGLAPLVVTAEQKGDTADMARLRASEFTSGKYVRYGAVIIGGETTPTLPDNAGKGGRNQHYAATSLLAMMEYPGEWTLASVGTDGSDFLPDIAGAIVDKSSVLAAREKGIDISTYLQRYDSFNLLEIIGHSLIKTGNTGTNVGDVLVYILG